MLNLTTSPLWIVGTVLVVATACFAMTGTVLVRR